MSASNNAPKIKWWRVELSNGTIRRKLYVNGSETPFFIDTPKHHSERFGDDKHNLWGAGMGDRTSAGWCCAGLLDFGNRVEALKHRAEQMALN